MKYAMLFCVGFPMLSAAAEPGGWSVSPMNEPWALDGFAEALDLSAIAAANEVHCVVGSDELHHLQLGMIDRDGHTVRAVGSIALPTIETGKKGAEVDIEGIAVSRSEAAYYVTGSHGVGKKKGDFQKDRNSIYRVPFDPATGKVKEDKIERTSLLPWLEGESELSPFVGHPLQMNGLNFEGLAHAGGKLYFGARGPSIGGTGFVVEASTASLFGGAEMDAKIHSIAVGEGRGIREIVAVSDGFLILTGNSSAEVSKVFTTSLAPENDDDFRILHWDPAKGEVVEVAELEDRGGKAEAMLVLSETRDALEVLVIYDGLKDGGAVGMRLVR